MDQKNDNSKFSSIFQNISVVLGNRKRESSKTYFKNPGFKSILLTVSSIIVIAIFYFKYLNVYNVEYNNDSLKSIYSQIILMFLCLSVGLFLPLVLHKEKHTNFFSYCSIPIIIIGLICTYLLKENTLSYALSLFIFSLGCGISLGVSINIFFFVYDISEKLIYCLMVAFVIFSYSFYFKASIPSIIKDIIIPCVLLLISYVCLLLNKDILVFHHNPEIIPKYSIFILILMLILVTLSSGITGAVQEIVHRDHTTIFESYYSITHYIGFILSIGFVILIFLFAKNSIVMLITVYFIGLFGAYIFTMFNYMFNPELIYNFDYKIWRQFADVAFGFTSSLGIVIILMLAGKILDDKCNTKTLMFIVFSFICYFLSSIFLKRFLLSIDIRLIIIIMICLTAFAAFIFSLFTSIGLFELRSTKDTPIGQIDRNQILYTKINPEEVLTPKEKVVMELLLEGLTLRQIAGELSMKYDSVNFHYKNIYRKLEVNSKIELILRYGKDK